MRAIELRERGGLEHLTLTERPDPTPGPGDVVIQLKAASLNFRDLAIARGSYGTFDLPIIPVSDGAGEVVATGAGVERFAVGDRVSPLYVMDWLAGPPSADVVARRLGGPQDGVLADYICVPQHAAVRSPAHMSDAEVACLPIAGLTAWQALFVQGNVRPGDVVVVQGSGGVSVFALQLAAAAGARVIATSSSDAKLERLRAMGASEGINYRDQPQWHEAVDALTGGRGADHVIEVVGGDNLNRSIAATRIGGTISLIGFLDSPTASINLPEAFRRVLNLQAISVGNRAGHEALIAACEASNLHPVIDRAFPLTETVAAFEHLASGQHFGKVVIEH